MRRSGSNEFLRHVFADNTVLGHSIQIEFDFAESVVEAKSTPFVQVFLRIVHSPSKTVQVVQ